jgi:toxin ParE1/3/4
MKVVVSPTAREDILQIWSYIARDSTAAADRVSDRIFDALDQLGIHPLIGERCDDLGAGLRRTLVEVYVIFYVVSEDEEKIDIKAVIHGARDLPEELSRRSPS